MEKTNSRPDTPASGVAFANVGAHRPTLLFVLLGGFFITNTLVAEFIGVKIFALEDTLGVAPFNFNLFGQPGALQFSAGVLLWPVVFIMTDIINEYFGKRGIRLLSILTAGLITYAFLALSAAIALAPADWWQTQYQSNGVPDMQQAFGAIFGQGMLMIIASLSAFMLAQLADVVSFHRIKQITGESKIWLRATGSTVISQLIDTFVVLIIAFKWGPALTGQFEPWSWSQLLAVATVQYTYKFGVAVVLTPLLYWAHAIIDRFLGPDLAANMKQAAAGWE
jgi:uncharacterized integral membrane protein (TIGR00697 family)